MGRKGSIYFPNLFALFILSLSVLFPHFWFVLPAATNILSRSRSVILKIVPWISFALAFVVATQINTALTELDVLALILFFIEGLCLHWILRREAKLEAVVWIPLLVGLSLSAILYAASYSQGLTTSFEQWVDQQMRSEVFPYFFRPDDWPDDLEGIYKSILLPVFRHGIFAWYACTLSMAFFVNGVLESLIRGGGNIRKRVRPKVWDAFSHWKASETLLIGIFGGLVLLVLNKVWAPFFGDLWLGLGWHVFILSMFPVFIQGIAVASYFIPRVSFFFFILIFALIIFKPIPVLILAGLSDLWFDFRSRVHSDPSG